MRASIRLLAAVSRDPPSKLKKPAISLDHVSKPGAAFAKNECISRDEANGDGQFIQRGRVLAFWREIVRALNSTLASLFSP